MKDKEFNEKYKKEIEGISKANNVDLSVAKSMFTSNLDNSIRGVSFEAYKGGGVAQNYEEMKEDYKVLKDNAIEKTRNTKTSNSRGQTVNAIDLIENVTPEGKLSEKK